MAAARKPGVRSISEHSGSKYVRQISACDSSGQQLDVDV